jgi:hypothetical protein
VPVAAVAVERAEPGPLLGVAALEDDPLDPAPPAAMRTTMEAIRHLEEAVTGAEDIEGLVLRYGGFYGPGTSIEPGGRRSEREGRHERAESDRRLRGALVRRGTRLQTTVTDLPAPT